MSEWQPIETAPRDGTPVLLTNGDTMEVGGWQEGWRGKPGTFWCQGCDEYPVCINATHWMPLPPPPPLKTVDSRHSAMIPDRQTP